MIVKPWHVVLVATLAVAGFLLACIAAVLFRQDPGEANFDRIQRGMTRPSVDVVMGRPPDRGDDVGGDLLIEGRVFFWNAANEEQIYVIFENGKVTRKGWIDTRRTFWRRVRSWFQ